MLNEVALWKRVALPILESYAEATDGSFIQDKESAVVWHFNNADPDFGTWQSKELVTHLEDLLVGHPVDVNVGGYTVEIKPKGITKAEAVEQALKHMAAEGKVANLVGPRRLRPAALVQTGAATSPFWRGRSASIGG